MLALIAMATTARAQENMINGHEYVDLGLPSGTLWATCNVGATNPEEYGDYFAWGETVGYKINDSHSFDWANYKWCNGSKDKLTKYCDKSNYGNNGFTDNKTELDLEDDAAYVNWGSNWRMPSREQFQELIDNCNWEWTTFKGVYGQKATSKKNGNRIFFPAGGWRTSEGWMRGGANGKCWSRSLSTDDPNFAYYLNFFSDSNDVVWYFIYRRFGYNVRPVRR